MWVKICGITNLEDAQLAADAGADAVGFVFGTSRRQVTVEQVAAITRQLPETIERIGLFANETAEGIADVVRTAGLTGVQLQGDEPPEVTAVLRQLNVRRLVKTVWVSGGIDTLAERVAAHGATADSVLLDSGSVSSRGGTGTRFDWVDVAAQLSKIRDSTPIIVAGGLTPSNVATAIASLHPWGVDVATGVERKPGRKDADKVRAFIAAAREAEKD